MNALEIRKREAKIFILSRQLEDIEEDFKNSKENVVESNSENTIPNEIAFLERHI